jgi:hypothetical protein
VLAREEGRDVGRREVQTVAVNLDRATLVVNEPAPQLHQKAERDRGGFSQRLAY